MCAEPSSIYPMLPRGKNLRDLMVPLLLSGGIAGMVFRHGRAGSKVDAILATCLGVLLTAAVLKWAIKRKRRLILVGFGVLGVFVLTVLAFVWSAIFRNTLRKGG